MSRERKALARNNRIKRLRSQDFGSYQPSNLVMEESIENPNTEKVSFIGTLKNIWLVLRNKTDTHGNMTSGAFAVLVSIVFRAVALVGFFIFLAGGYVLFHNITQMSWQGWLEILKNIYAITLVAMILLILGMYAILMWGASNEMRKERDKNYIVSVFSGVVSFAALIVALVALLKG